MTTVGGEEEDPFKLEKNENNYGTAVSQSVRETTQHSGQGTF
jgi:hypothetical protein